MSQQPAELELTPPTATLWLNRPDRANTIDGPMAAALSERVAELEGRNDVSVLFIRGTGGRFCAGADLRELTSADLARMAQIDSNLATSMERLAALPMVVVAAVEAFAYGGGFLICLYADLRIATAGARLGFTPLGQQWLPPWGLSRLAGWLGPLRAQQFLIARGEVLAEQALALGLFDQVVQPGELQTALDQLSARFSHARTDVLREAKTFFAQFKGAPHAHWDRVSAAGFARTFSAKPAQDAIREFFQRKSR